MVDALMAVRVRSTGEIVCAAMHPEMSGDTYLHDGIHYTLSAELGALVTEPMQCDSALGGHAAHGLWWWRGEAPPEAKIDPYYDNRWREHS